ncbi:MAG: RNA 2',3'-cyclic phosphodiesterase [Anaerolinea sp.]|nr:RNA 2',3'-cyclic phosphodiesterase [Anaerolinea sp.]
MKPVRAFIAIELSTETRYSIQQVVNGYNQSIPRGWVRWVGVVNLHLTLKFLGDVPVELLPDIYQHMDITAAGVTSFNGVAAGVGMFPSSQKPRVIWLGLDAKQALSNLAGSLENELAKINIMREEKPFSPHLTIGRVNRDLTDDQLSKLGAIILRSQPGVVGEVTVERITLFRSDLRESGPIHTPLHQSALGKCGQPEIHVKIQ